MWSTKEYLAICCQLGEFSLFADWQPGLRIARGYADLGFEEFMLLSETKLLSLINGKISEVIQEDKRHFFVVPTADSLVQEIQRHNYDILELQYLEQRAWVLKLRQVESLQVGFSKGAILETALARGLLAIVSRVWPPLD